jgi:hypothetical protein
MILYNNKNENKIRNTLIIFGVMTGSKILMLKKGTRRRTHVKPE